MFRIPLPKPGYEGLADHFENLMKRLALQKQAEQENAYKQGLLELQQKELPSKLALRSAQTNQLNQFSDLPFGGKRIPGPAGQALALFMIKQKYGENSPEFVEAKKQYDLSKRKAEQSIAYQKSLMESQPKRYATQAGKTAQEQAEIEQGFMPGTTSTGQRGIPLTPEQQEKLKGQYSLTRLKSMTDSGIRQRILYSKNMEKTLDNLSVDDLTTYSGIKGAGELIKDKTEALKGNISPRYQKYSEALTAADTLAKQVRQFYGDSITAGVQKELKKLTNPASWLEHPKVAKARFNAFKKILQTEAKTFTDASKDAKIFEESKPSIGNELHYNIETGEFE